jgi:hypothetical protein
MDINKICKIESVQKSFIKEKSVILEKFRKKKRRNRIIYDEEILVARFNSRSKE